MEEPNKIHEFFKYIDCFGTKYNFYIERNRKFYTVFGGIITFLSVIISVLFFILLNYSELVHDNPITSTYIIRENYSNIKFGEEKIWIPWRIRDYYNHKINHNNLFYPLIYYYKGKKNETTKRMDLTYDFIDYKLCNETSMANRSHLYLINISLDDLYCIDMEELNVGGNWQANFINYIEFDLYVCNNGINYNESDGNCTSYEKISEIMENNSYEMEIFYPLVYYQPTNKSIPVIVKYTSYFYHFSRYSNKIDRLYLQKYIFSDDEGWFNQNIKNYSYWGQSSLAGDCYTTGEKRDLMNEGSTSRLYSFNIYLNSDIICYKRSYKKIMIIIAESLPIINVIIVLLGLLTKLFKESSGNKKLTELLFVNLKEKHNIKRNYRSKNQNINNFLYKKNQNFKSNNSNNISNITDISSSLYNLNNQHTLNNKLNINLTNKSKQNSSDNKNKDDNQNQKASNFIENYSNLISNDSFNRTINNININIRNDNSEFENKNSGKKRNYLSSKYARKTKKEKGDKLAKSEKHYVKQKLFPYKYYLFSIFIKNLNVRNKSFFFTKKFLNVYNFICQILDISSYLILQKEFQTIKNTLMRGKYKEIIENTNKINVNDRAFNIDMKECLDYKKLSILGNVKNNNSISENMNFNFNPNSNSINNNLN